MRTKLPQNSDTIVAVATPPGEGGIGILRLSGPEAPAALARLWRGKRKVDEFESHRLYHGSFWDPETLEILENGLAVWMKAPRSYTGEEVIEIQVHGGPFLLNALQDSLVGLGLRVAEPGEFTRRAFLNGKLDLLQAEAVGAKIHAKSQAALKNAQGQLAGRLSAEVGELRTQLIGLLARVEAAIDFPEEDIEIIQPTQTLGEIELLQDRLRAWLEKFHLGRLVREGVRVALVGRPNVGKSSLLNRLVGQEKAIVHHHPGTTRDVVEGWLDLKGVGFQLFDTAGIRRGQGTVEQEGIARSQRILEQADLTLWILDVSEKLQGEDRAILDQMNGQTLVVGNKSDLPLVTKTFPQDWPWPPKGTQAQWLFISAHTGAGIPELKEAMGQRAGLGALENQAQAYLNNGRHREALLAAQGALDRASSALHSRGPTECVAADLREATAHLEALLGEVSTEDVLDKVFSEFCLGK